MRTAWIVAVGAGVTSAYAEATPSAAVRPDGGGTDWAPATPRAVLAAAAPTVDAPRTPAPWKAFVFDGSFQGSGELHFDLSRPVQTIGPDSLPVAPNVARYSNPTSIASAPSVQTIRATTGYTVMLASGLDHDGVTPLLVTYEDRSSVHYLDVFAGPADSILTAEQTGNGRTRTTVGASRDLLHGAYPGKRYLLTAGVVCHGLIVLFSTISTFDAGSQTWLPSADAFYRLTRSWTHLDACLRIGAGCPRGPAGKPVVHAELVANDTGRPPAGCVLRGDGLLLQPRFAGRSLLCDARQARFTDRRLAS